MSNNNTPPTNQDTGAEIPTEEPTAIFVEFKRLLHVQTEIPQLYEFVRLYYNVFNDNIETLGTTINEDQSKILHALMTKIYQDNDKRENAVKKLDDIPTVVQALETLSDEFNLISDLNEGIEDDVQEQDLSSIPVSQVTTQESPPSSEGFQATSSPTIFSLTPSQNNPCLIKSPAKRALENLPDSTPQAKKPTKRDTKSSPKHLGPEGHKTKISINTRAKNLVGQPNFTQASSSDPMEVDSHDAENPWAQTIMKLVLIMEKGFKSLKEELTLAHADHAKKLTEGCFIN